MFTLKQIGEKVREKKRRVYVCFIDFQKAHVRIKRDALWEILRIYVMGVKLLSGNKSMYV